MRSLIVTSLVLACAAGFATKVRANDDSKWTIPMTGPVLYGLASHELNADTATVAMTNGSGGDPLGQATLTFAVKAEPVPDRGRLYFYWLPWTGNTKEVLDFEHQFQSWSFGQRVLIHFLQTPPPETNPPTPPPAGSALDPGFGFIQLARATRTVEGVPKIQDWHVDTRDPVLHDQKNKIIVKPGQTPLYEDQWPQETPETQQPLIDKVLFDAPGPNVTGTLVVGKKWQKQSHPGKYEFEFRTWLWGKVNDPTPASTGPNRLLLGCFHWKFEGWFKGRNPDKYRFEPTVKGQKEGKTLLVEWEPYSTNFKVCPGLPKYKELMGDYAPQWPGENLYLPKPE